MDEHRLVNLLQPWNQPVMHNPVPEVCGMDFPCLRLSGDKTYGTKGGIAAAVQFIKGCVEIIQKTHFVLLGIGSTPLASAASQVCVI